MKTATSDPRICEVWDSFPLSSTLSLLFFPSSSRMASVANFRRFLVPEVPHRTLRRSQTPLSRLIPSSSSLAPPQLSSAVSSVGFWSPTQISCTSQRSYFWIIWCGIRCTKARRSAGYLDPVKETATANKFYNHFVRRVSSPPSIVVMNFDFSESCLMLSHPFPDDDVCELRVTDLCFREYALNLLMLGFSRTLLSLQWPAPSNSGRMFLEDNHSLFDCFTVHVIPYY